MPGTSLCMIRVHMNSVLRVSEKKKRNALAVRSRTSSKPTWRVVLRPQAIRVVLSIYNRLAFVPHYFVHSRMHWVAPNAEHEPPIWRQMCAGKYVG